MSTDSEPIFLVISPTSHFIDDVRAMCFRCLAFGYHRPHSPRASKKLCFRCYQRQIAGDPDPKIFVTDETVRELTAYARAKWN